MTLVRFWLILCFASLAGLAAWNGQKLRSSSSVERRPTEGRLSQKSDYAAFDARWARTEISQQNAAVRKELDAPAGEGRGEILRRSGALHLFLGQTDRAVRMLEEARVSLPSDGPLLSDLSAAYLARAHARSDPFDLILALSAADRAVTATPTLQAARFNRALALKKLHLENEARTAWDDYLALDATSGWAGEARTRRDALDEPSPAENWNESRRQLLERQGEEQFVNLVTARFPQEIRQYAEETLLGAWADAARSRDTRKAAQVLAIVRRIGVALSSQRGDWMVADTVGAIDASENDVKRRAALQDGHSAYRDAQKMRPVLRTSEARPLFEMARRNFLRARSPAESLARLYIAVGDFQHSSYPPALYLLRRIVREKQSQRYPGLLARAHWTMGLVLLGLGQPTESLDAYRRSLAAARRAGAVEDVAGTHAVLAENFRYLGQTLQNWRHLHAALSLAPRIRTPRRLSAILFEVAEACSAAGQHSVAFYFRSESVRVARAAGEPASLANALIYRAATAALLGHQENAGKDLAEARWIAEQVRDEPQRLRLFAYLLIVESGIDASRDPKEAVQSLTWALDFFDQRNNHFFASRLYLARARAEMALGQDEQAEADLRRGIEEFELQRGRVLGELFRVSFFDQADSLFDEMVRLQVRRPGGPESALHYAERERARSLLDRLGPMTGRQRSSALAEAIEPLDLREIQRGVPPDVALVEYAMLDDRLLAWVIQADRFGFQETPVEAMVLDQLSTRLRAAISSGQLESARSSSATLYDLLVRPILPRLRVNDRIVFVPDGGLTAVPFAALLDRKSGRYLLQDRTLSVAPSATVYVEATKRDRSLASFPNPTALLIANPLAPRAALPTLPWSEVEAAAVLRLFPGSEILARESATRGALLAAAGQHAILHFGGHAVINRDFPLLSHLQMAPESKEDSGLLFVGQLYGVEFERTQLAVLAGCDTAAGPIREEGALSLARAFLAVGIPGVVASQWPVEDRETSRLLQLFYEHLRRGDDTATALRQAQIVLLSEAGTNHSSGTWAAFQLFGATSAITHKPKEEDTQ